jgi:hypothetical protein
MPVTLPAAISALLLMGSQSPEERQTVPPHSIVVDINVDDNGYAKSCSIVTLGAGVTLERAEQQCKVVMKTRWPSGVSGREFVFKPFKKRLTLGLKAIRG